MVTFLTGLEAFQSAGIYMAILCWGKLCLVQPEGAVSESPG